MCGINGLITAGNTSSDVINGRLSRMNNLIEHRGPDQDGFFSEEKETFAVGMAMRRLSIIDLNTGKQPMTSEDGKINLVFNGEIYNYRKLKKDLQDLGHLFKTTSDTEVILRLYQQFGTKSFQMLDGMFAFSIFDGNCDKIFIARDFFGEKPLYYSQEKMDFYWASELKSITEVKAKKSEISLEGLNLFFQLTYIPAPFTIYKDVFKLEANHFLEFDCLDFSFQIKKIQNESSEETDPEIQFEQAKEKTQNLIRESVKSRSVSDVPLGTFLSGGVDSSVISLCLAQQEQNKIDTFSVGFEKKSFDESEKARVVAKLIQSNHHEFIISEKDLKDNLNEILLNFDEPFADSSSLPTYLVAHKTRQQVKVALTGDGGDEVFGGYNKYYIGKLNNKYTSLLPIGLHNSFKKMVSPVLETNDDNRGWRFKTKKLLNAVNYEGDFYFKIISLGFQEEELVNLFRNDFLKEGVLGYYKERIGAKNKSLNDFRNIDRIMSLEGDMLVKVDRTSMLTSLESRAPFLNKKLWDFTSQIPDRFLMKGWNKKFLLKESFKGHFPKGFLDKSKKGFGVPVGDWLRGYLKKELESYCEKELIISQNIFIYEEISVLVKNHLSGKKDNTFRVWTFFCFQKWYLNTYLKIRS